MRFEFEGQIIYWKGPSPYHFVAVPDDESSELHDVSAMVSYGWGVIPVEAKVGASTWTTSLFPKNGRYLVPIKTSIRRAEGLGVDDHVAVTLSIESLHPNQPLKRSDSNGVAGRQR